MMLYQRQDGPRILTLGGGFGIDIDQLKDFLAVDFFRLGAGNFLQ